MEEIDRYLVVCPNPTQIAVTRSHYEFLKAGNVIPGGRYRGIPVVVYQNGSCDRA
jgi:hypothetical protein